MDDPSDELTVPQDPPSLLERQTEVAEIESRSQFSVVLTILLSLFAFIAALTTGDIVAWLTFGACGTAGAGLTLRHLLGRYRVKVLNREIAEEHGRLSDTALEPAERRIAWQNELDLMEERRSSGPSITLMSLLVVLLVLLGFESAIWEPVALALLPGSFGAWIGVRALRARRRKKELESGIQGLDAARHKLSPPEPETPDAEEGGSQILLR